MRIKLYVLAVAFLLVLIWGDFNHFGRPYVVAKTSNAMREGVERFARIHKQAWPMPGETRAYVINRWLTSGGYRVREDVLVLRADGTMRTELTCLEESTIRVTMGCLEHVDSPGHNPDMLKLMRNLGFAIKAYPDDPEFKLVTHSL
jgi:hypothetical protein